MCAIHEGTYTGRIILVGKANECCDKIVEKYRNSGVSASKAQIINKILIDYAQDMPIGELTRKMQLLRLHFCFLTFTERDYVDGTEVQVALRIPARDLVREVKKFNTDNRATSNIRELVNTIIHDYIGIAKLHGMNFDDYYIKLKNVTING